MSFDRRLVVGSVVATVLPLGALVRAGAALADATKDRTSAEGFIVIEAREGMIRLLPEPAGPTPVWGYDGTVPGPLLRIKKGTELRVRLVNRLSQPTSLCWHGLRGPNAMDGVAGLTQAAVEPGGHFDYRFVPPDAGLYWYHPHVWPFSAEQIARGLYGVLVVDEPAPPPADEELLVVFDDWTLDAKGGIGGDFLKPAPAQGRVGALVTANSKPVPLPATVRPGTRLRLRMLSVASARIMFVTFEDAHPMVQAIDGQPCELFEPVRQTLPVGPGARFDVMVDCPAKAGDVMRVMLRGESKGEPDRALLTFKTAGEPRTPREPIAVLPQNPALPAMIPLERALKMDLVIEANPKPAASKAGTAAGAAWAWTVNGVASDGFSGKPLFKVKRGAAVSLAFVNKTGFAQQIHVHGHVMRLLHDLDDGWEPYWRESVLVAENHTKHVAFIADNPGKWAIESLILDRQNTGLAAWFEVG